MTQRYDVVGVIDINDAGLVDGHVWTASKNHKNTWVISTKVSNNTVGIHTMLTGYPMTDHIDRDATNNRRSNLRSATRTQNSLNRGRLSSNSSGLTGVSWNKFHGEWKAQIRINGRKKHLGYFEDRGEAAIVYDKAVLRTDPVFGVLNFPIFRDIYLFELLNDGAARP